jgi:hypothetical protein
MGDVQAAFGIITHCFMPSYLLWYTPPSSTFIKSLACFDSSFFQMFKCLLGSRSFDSQKGFLVRKHVFLPITFIRIDLILTTTIALTAYLRSWDLVVSIITIRFVVNQPPFLFKALTWVNNNTFLFQQHLKVACDLLSPLASACLLPFEQLIKQQMV